MSDERNEYCADDGIRKPLVVWIFQTGEPLHIDAGDPRPMRAMNLANALATRGHRVVLWSSDFFHQEKRHRSGKYTVTNVHAGLEVRLVPSIGYSRNIGPGRLIDHAVLAYQLRKALQVEAGIPDVAFVGYPPIEFAAVAVRWLKRRNVPSILDAKDQWPDIFVDPFPSVIRPAVKFLLAPYYLLGRRAMRDATALSSMSESYLEWMRSFGCRAASSVDGAYPLTQMTTQVSAASLEQATRWWGERDVTEDGGRKYCFIGSLSRAFDFHAIRDAASAALKQHKDWQFVICGDGPRLSELTHLFAEQGNVVLPGWVDRAKIVALAKLCAGGLAPYRNIKNFQENIPNKIIDYLSLGLPVVSPLRGELKTMMDRQQIGVTYAEGDGESLYQSLSGLCDDEARREQMATNALELYSREFTGELVYSRLVASLERLAATSQNHVSR